MIKRWGICGWCGREFRVNRYDQLWPHGKLDPCKGSKREPERITRVWSA